MKINKFKEKLILELKQSIESVTKDHEKDMQQIARLKELETNTKIIFNKVKKLINNSKIKNEMPISFYTFSKPNRQIEELKCELAYNKDLKSNYKRLLKAAKITDDRNSLEILSYVYDCKYLKIDSCFIPIHFLKNMPILFNSNTNMAYISIHGCDLNIKEYPIYDGALFDYDKYAVTVFSKLSYDIQVNYFTQLLKESPNASKGFKYFQKKLPKSAEIHDFLNKLATFS